MSHVRRCAMLFSLLLLLPARAAAQTGTLPSPACEPYSVPFTPAAFPERKKPVRVSIDGGWLEVASLGRRLGSVHLGFTPRRAEIHGTRVVVVGPGRGLTLVDLTDLTAPRIDGVLVPYNAVDGYRIEGGRLFPTAGGQALCRDSVLLKDLQKKQEAADARRPRWIAAMGLGLGVAEYLYSSVPVATVELHLLRETWKHHYLGLMVEGSFGAGLEHGSFLSLSALGYRYLGDHFFVDVAPVIAWASGCTHQPEPWDYCDGETDELTLQLKVRPGWMFRWGRKLVGVALEAQVGQAFFLGLNVSFGFGWGRSP